MIAHPIPPIYDGQSRVLILGSFPSVKSRAQAFFYAHPQNRFWKMLSMILGKNLPETIEEKLRFLLENKIALWDVIASCEINGSSDSSIRNASPNNIEIILRSADINLIIANGQTAKKYYDKFLRSVIRRDALCLPSTSPANARLSLENLINEWQIIKQYL